MTNEKKTQIAVVGMAFLSKGHTPGYGPYGDTINRCIDYVKRSQNADGEGYWPAKDGTVNPRTIINKSSFLFMCDRIKIATGTKNPMTTVNS